MTPTKGMTGVAARLAALSCAALLCLAQQPRSADPEDSEFERTTLELATARDELVALDERGASRSVRLNRMDERVLGLDSRGQLGIARTSERLLAIRAGGGDWVDLAYDGEERAEPPTETYLARRAALVPLGRRLAAFTTASREWFSLRLPGDETLVSAHSSAQLVVAATTRRLLAVDPRGAQFVEIRLKGDEQARSASSSDRAITVTTSERVLAYVAGSGRWSELGPSPE